MSCLQIIQPKETRRVKTIILFPEQKAEHLEHVYVPWRPMLSIRGLGRSDLAHIDTDLYLPTGREPRQGFYEYRYHRTYHGRVRT
jgi:hypothetical protein